MAVRAWEEIPQIVAIVSVSRDGKINLKKAVRQQIGLDGARALCLDIQDEVMLTTNTNQGQEVPLAGRNRLQLPESVLVRLGLTGGSLVGLVQRPDAVALKRVEIIEVAADRVRLIDIESAAQIVRRVETTPMPDDLLPRLAEQHKSLALRYDVLSYVKGVGTLAAWKTRALLRASDPEDDALRGALIEDRLSEQDDEGSWGGQVILTARALRELADLGMTREKVAVRRGADWLLARPQSAYNPGMFFATDELVEEQARVIARRGRFRELKAGEKRRVMGGDDMIHMPCGPRIMWPNALVLEALLSLGYEGTERVQVALRSMRTYEWCECGYQHGMDRWKRSEPLSMDEIAAFESSCIRQYRYGGLRDLKDLKRADMSQPTFAYPRITCRETAQGSEYVLRMNEHTQGCEFITTRALSRVQDPLMRRFAEAHLWRFAGRQLAPDGAFPVERYGTGFDQAGILEAMSRYDHPACKVAVMRALPWIVEAQNEDGSWGEEPRRDAATLAIVSALCSVRAYLPPGLAPW